MTVEESHQKLFLTEAASSLLTIRYTRLNHMAAFYARVSQDQHCAVTAAKSEKCWLSVDMLLALLANYAGLCTAWMLQASSLSDLQV